MSNFNYFKVSKDFLIEENEYELSVCKKAEEVLESSDDPEVLKLVQSLKALYMEGRLLPRSIVTGKQLKLLMINKN